MTDTELMALPIPARNALLDELAYEAESAAAKADWEAEQATERWYEHRGYQYAGSRDEYEDQLATWGLGWA